MSLQPEWLLERAALGEAPASVVADAEALDALRASNEAILSELPPSAVVAEIERRLRAAEPPRRPSRTRARLAFAGTALAAAAAVLLWINRGDRGNVVGTDPAELDGGTRIKGDPRLVIHRKANAGVTRLAPTATVRAGDLLQLSYIAAGRPHGVIVSIDGRGSVTLHSPSSADEPTTLSPGRITPLAHAYRLDDAPRFERFFLVTARRPIDVGLVLAAAERLAASQRLEQGSLELPHELEQTSVLLRKSEMP